MTPALMAFLGVTALLVSGASLIASAIRLNHETLARRIDLVGLPATTAISSKSDTQKNSPRLPSKGRPFTSVSALRLLD